MDVKPTATQELVRLRTGREVEPLLRELYLEKRLTDREIAEAIGVDRVTVNKWRRDYGIKREERPDAQELIA